MNPFVKLNLELEKVQLEDLGTAKRVVSSKDNTTVVDGAGVALVRAVAKIADLQGDNEDQTHGVKLALRAMEAPLRQIASLMITTEAMVTAAPQDDAAAPAM